MKASKTDFIIFCSRRLFPKINITSINICQERVAKSEVVKYLGAWLDQSLTYKYHIKWKCKIAMYNIQRIKHIHYMLTEEACRILVQNLVISHLDYGNALFISLPDCDLDKLQQIQNIAAKVILGRGRMDSPSEAMYHLHWLPIRQRIQHKTAMLTFKCISGEAPQCLKDMISVDHQSTPGLCSNNKCKRLHEPKTLGKAFANWSFKMAAPRLWNRLPNDVKSSPTLDTFKRSLKTFLFRQAFSRLSVTNT